MAGWSNNHGGGTDPQDDATTAVAVMVGVGEGGGGGSPRRPELVPRLASGSSSATLIQNLGLASQRAPHPASPHPTPTHSLCTSRSTRFVLWYGFLVSPHPTRNPTHSPPAVRHRVPGLGRDARGPRAGERPPRVRSAILLYGGGTGSNRVVHAGAVTPLPQEVGGVVAVPADPPPAQSASPPLPESCRAGSLGERTNRLESWHTMSLTRSFCSPFTCAVMPFLPPSEEL